MSDNKGILGTITTIAGGAASWLPCINEVIQIIAGIVAIIVGIVTIRHYQKKDKEKNK